MGILGAVLLPLFVLVPGFVYLGVYSRNKRGPEHGDARFIARALVGSIGPHILLLGWTIRLVQLWLSQWKHEFAAIGPGETTELAAWSVSLIFLVPAILGIVASSFLDAEWSQPFLGKIGWTKAARTTTAWEWAFFPAEPCWLLVTLNDGTVVGGEFGEAAFVGYDRTQQDLFIPNPYLVYDDRTFGPKLEGSKGLWINSKDIVTVEIYEGEE